MKVTIWDLDYYYSDNKVNCFNPDVMKISSYHKQLGDEVNFVIKKDDIYRPYDLYYIIKENQSTPNPPYDFFTNSKVKWWGDACKFRINWEMDAVMLGCRPDYLLYPEKNTNIERAEQVRLLDNKGNLLPIKQDWHNSFKNKKVIVTDTKLWTTKPEITIRALKELQECKNLYFLEPIWLRRFIDEPSILEEFLKLNFCGDANLVWIPIFIEDYEMIIPLLCAFRKRWPSVKLGPLKIRYRSADHWDSPQYALEDWNALKTAIVDSKQKGIVIKPIELKSRLDTPYFLLFETVSNWMSTQPMMSWLEWITAVYGPGLRFRRNTTFWSHPEKWNPVFRDLLRQTRHDQEFLLTQWGNKKVSENDVPWAI